MKKRNKLSAREVAKCIADLKVECPNQSFQNSETWNQIFEYLRKKNDQKSRYRVWKILTSKVTTLEEESADNRHHDQTINVADTKVEGMRRRRKRPKRLSSSECEIPKYLIRWRNFESQSKTVSTEQFDTNQKDMYDGDIPYKGSSPASGHDGKCSSPEQYFAHPPGTDGECSSPGQSSDEVGLKVASDSYKEKKDTYAEDTSQNEDFSLDSKEEDVEQFDMNDFESDEEINKGSSSGEDEMNSDKEFFYPTKFTFEITHAEYSKIAPNSGHSFKWRRLTGEWTDIFQKKFNEVVPSCVLVFTYNRVKKEGSRKSSAPFFKGRAECKYKKCAIYDFTITEEPSTGAEGTVQVAVQRTGKIVHERGRPLKRHLKGTRRKIYAKRLKRVGVGNFHHELLGEMPTEKVEAGNFTECSTPTILHKVLQETHQNKKSYNYREELLTTQTVISRLDSESAEIHGYIQTISSKPFSMILFTEDQLKLLNKEIKSGNNVLYLDATGSVVRKYDDMAKDVFYYAMILKNRLKKEPAIPIAELVSSDQTTPMISYFLLKFRHAFKKVVGRLPSLKRIEIDFSWPLLHSALSVFKNRSISEYLNDCWEALNSQDENADDVMSVHLCSWHMLRSLGRCLECSVKDKSLKTYIKYCFGLLQNATTLKEAKDIYIDVCSVLNNRYLSHEVRKSIYNLKRKISSLPDKVEIETENDMTRESKASLIKMDAEVRGTLKDNSPFTTFFSIKKSTDNDSDEELDYNAYFSPEGLKCLDRFMYLFPLWSGVMLKQETTKHFQDTITRDTQCYVENWFGIVKNSILQKEKRLSPAEFAVRLYVNLRGRIRRYEIASDLCSLGRRRTKSPHQEKEGHGMMAEEKWKRKGRRKQSVYLSPGKFPEPKSRNGKIDGKSRRTKKDFQHGEAKVKTQSQKPEDEASKLNVKSNEHTFHGKKRKLVDISCDDELPTEKKKRNEKMPCSTRKGRERFVRCGLINKGNSCWLNSTIQAFKGTDLSFDLASGEHQSSFTREVRNIMRQMDDISNDPINLAPLMRELRSFSLFRDLSLNQQQDPAMLVNTITSEFMKEAGMDEFRIRYLHECLRCNKERYSSDDLVRVLSVEMPISFKVPSIQDCIDEFFKEETLCGQNSLNCSNCKQKTPQTRKAVVDSLPEFLVVQLKRFNSFLQKISLRVHLNRQITLQCHANNKQKRTYSLRSVQVHLGKTISVGHYTTLCIEENRLLLLDDCKVSRKPIDFLNSSYIQGGCYIAYYVADPIRQESIQDSDECDKRDSNDISRKRSHLLPESDVDSIDDTNWLNDQNDESDECDESYNIVSRKGPYVLRKSDMDTINDTNWLNDQVINSYLYHLSSSNKRMKFLDTFSITSLKRRGQKVQEKLFRDINEHDLLFIPLHKPLHWCMIIYFIEKEEYIVVDSIGNTNIDEDIRVISEGLKCQKKGMRRNVVKERRIPKCRESGACGPYILWVSKMFAHNLNLKMVKMAEFRDELKRALS